MANTPIDAERPPTTLDRSARVITNPSEVLPVIAQSLVGKDATNFAFFDTLSRLQALITAGVTAENRAEVSAIITEVRAIATSTVDLEAIIAFGTLSQAVLRPLEGYLQTLPIPESEPSVEKDKLSEWQASLPALVQEYVDYVQKIETAPPDDPFWSTPPQQIEKQLQTQRSYAEEFLDNEMRNGEGSAEQRIRAVRWVRENKLGEYADHVGRIARQWMLHIHTIPRFRTLEVEMGTTLPVPSDTTRDIIRLQSIYEAVLNDPEVKGATQAYQDQVRQDPLLQQIEGADGKSGRRGELITLWRQWLEMPGNPASRVADKRAEIDRDFLTGTNRVDPTVITRLTAEIQAIEDLVSVATGNVQAQIDVWKTEYISALRIDLQRVVDKESSLDKERARFRDIKELAKREMLSIEIERPTGEQQGVRLGKINGVQTGYLDQMLAILKATANQDVLRALAAKRDIGLPEILSAGGDPDLLQEYADIEMFLRSKIDLYNTHIALRSATEEEPLLIDNLVKRRTAYDLNTNEIDYFINTSRELNPKNQCREVTKKIRGLDNNYHEVTYTETPVAMVMGMIDDILDGRFEVPYAGGGGGENTVTGRNFHQATAVVAQAIQERSATLTSDGSKFSDDTIRTAMRLYTITVMGQAHESPLYTPGTSNQFTKAFLYETYCKVYADTGKDTFLPRLPYMLFGSTYEGNDPEILQAVAAYEQMRQKIFRKLNHEERHHIQWFIDRGYLYHSVPQKSAHHEIIGGKKTLIPTHYGYSIHPPMQYLTVGRFPKGSTMAFDHIREEGTDRRAYNLMPYVEQRSGLFAGVKPPDRYIVANYYTNLIGQVLPLLRDVLMAEPGKLKDELGNSSHVGAIIKTISDGWEWVGYSRDRTKKQVAEDKKRFHFLLVYGVIEWCFVTGAMDNNQVEDYLLKLQHKEANGDPFLSHEEAEIIEKIAADLWVELQEEFGKKAASIIEHAGTGHH